MKEFANESSLFGTMQDDNGKYWFIYYKKCKIYDKKKSKC